MKLVVEQDQYYFSIEIKFSYFSSFKVGIPGKDHLEILILELILSSGFSVLSTVLQFALKENAAREKKDTKQCSQKQRQRQGGGSR
jgi:hypothetical protein